MRWSIPCSTAVLRIANDVTLIGPKCKSVYISNLHYSVIVMNLKQLVSKIGHFTQNNPFDTFFILFFILLVIILSSLYLTVDFDDEHWEEFKAEHHCQVRTTKYGTQRASWVCDDGKTYFRWRQQR